MTGMTQIVSGMSPDIPEKLIYINPLIKTGNLLFARCINQPYLVARIIAVRTCLYLFGLNPYNCTTG